MASPPPLPDISIRKEAASLKVSSISSSCYEVSESQRDGGRGVEGWVRSTHTGRNDLGRDGGGEGGIWSVKERWSTMEEL